MKTRTRRFKVVSYLVLLTMIVSLFGPMGTMKKVMATGNYYFTYRAGQWYTGFGSGETVVEDIQASIKAVTDGEVNLNIEDKAQDAFLSLGKQFGK